MTDLYCIVTSGRISDTPFGEEKFSLSFGKWLVDQNSNVAIIGSKLIGTTVKYFSKLDMAKHNSTVQKQIIQIYPPYLIIMLSRLLFSLMCVSKIISINKKSKIKIIHAQDTGYSGLASVIAGKIIKVPVVITSHGIRHRTLASILNGRLEKLLLKFEYKLDLFTLRNADGIIALNPEIKSYYEKLTGKKVDFIPNPIKLKDFIFSSHDRNIIRNELAISEQTKLIGFIGRLSPEKNIITLLDSFSAEILTNPNLKLIIVGIGKQETQLKEESKKRNITDKIIFCGLRSDVSQILSGMDIFVLPSHTEGLSSSLLEAMSCGCTIICSDIPANQLLVTHNVEGLLVNPNSSKDLQDAIHLLSTDDLLRKKLSDNAKIKVTQYDEGIVFPKILKCYLSLPKKEKRLKEKIC